MTLENSFFLSLGWKVVEGMIEGIIAAALLADNAEVNQPVRDAGTAGADARR